MMQNRSGELRNAKYETDSIMTTQHYDITRIGPLSGNPGRWELF
jgi:hypothetical protein